MAQIIDPIPSNVQDPALCCYVNATNRIQVARITNIENWYFERVVFPGQRLVFEAVPEALLEIHCGMMASAIISDTIPCDRLRVDGDSSNPVSQSSASESENVAPSTPETSSLEKVARASADSSNHKMASLTPAIAMV